jgi:hypothetical protein
MLFFFIDLCLYKKKHLVELSKEKISLYIYIKVERFGLPAMIRLATIRRKLQKVFRQLMTGRSNKTFSGQTVTAGRQNRVQFYQTVNKGKSNKIFSGQSPQLRLIYHCFWTQKLSQI